VNKTVLYIGNDLSKNSKYPTMMATLSVLLESEGYKVVKSSSKKNQLFRLLDMISTTIVKSVKVDYVLIDTFSTKNFYYALLVSQIARVFKLKYIPILHGGNLPSRLERSPFLSRLIFKNSYINIAPSNYLKHVFEGKGFKVKFIPNVLEVENYSFKLRKEITPNILWVRAFKHLYNPMMAIEVLRKVKKKYPDASLCMIGPVKDDSFELVKSFVSDKNLDDSVDFTGVLSKEEWHKRSEEFDVFINTTNFDNTPVSVMEAMALGIPIVSTNVGGMPFLIEHKKHGVLVEKNDSNQMSDAIVKMIENPPKEMILNARKKVENFSWDQVRIQWVKLLC